MIGGATNGDMAIGISGCFTIAIAFGGIGIDGNKVAVFALDAKEGVVGGDLWNLIFDKIP